MGYGWRESGAELVELCDECGFDARDVADDHSALVAALEALAALLDHQDADRRSSPETWSAAEYVQHVCEVTQALLAYVADVTSHPRPGPVSDLADAGCAVSALVPVLSTADRAAVVRGVYSYPVTVEWVVRHLLHDVEHHVLDLRRNYARMALAGLPGSWDAGGGAG
jgi:hypothetical protein